MIKIRIRLIGTSQYQRLLSTVTSLIPIIKLHYHHRSFNYEFKVMLTVAYYRYKEFFLKPAYPSIFIRLLQIINRLAKEPSISIREKFYWMLHNITIIASDYMAIYKARKSIRRGGIKS